jgi:hypothetical protein
MADPNCETLLTTALQKFDANDYESAQAELLITEGKAHSEGNQECADFARAMFLFTRGVILSADAPSAEDSADYFRSAMKSFQAIDRADFAALADAMSHFAAGINHEIEDDFDEASDEYGKAGDLLEKFVREHRIMGPWALSQQTQCEILEGMALFRDFLDEGKFDSARALLTTVGQRIEQLGKRFNSQGYIDWYEAQGGFLNVELGLAEAASALAQWRPEDAALIAERVATVAQVLLKQIDGKSFPIARWNAIAQAQRSLPRIVEGIRAEAEGKKNWFEGDWAKTKTRLSEAIAHYREGRHNAESVGDGAGIAYFGMLGARLMESEGLLDQISKQTIPELNVTPDLSNLCSSQAERDSVMQDIEELARVYGSGAWKASVVMAGAVLEKLLCLKCLRNPGQAKATTTGTKANPSIDQWVLDTFIKVATESGWISQGVDKYCHAMREFRNIVHAGNQFRTGLQVKRGEAVASIQALRIAMRDLGLVTD